MVYEQILEAPLDGSGGREPDAAPGPVRRRAPWGPRRVVAVTAGVLLLSAAIAGAFAARRGSAPALRADFGQLGSWMEDGVQTAVAIDGLTATVVLPMPGGQALVYRLQASSPFTDDATVTEVNETGETVLMPFSTAFSGREAGRYASALFEEDGSVSGIFQHDGGFLEVRPREGGKAVTHRVRKLLEEDLPFPQHGQDRRLWELAVDEDNADHPHILEPRGEDPIQQLGAAKVWGGTKRWPTCYRGDQSMHVMKIGAATDVTAWKKYGSKVKKYVAQIVQEASVIYEVQMHIQIKLHTLKAWTSDRDAPSGYASSSCPSINNQLEAVTKDKKNRPFVAAYHVFTGCGTGYGTVGLAWIGTVCDSGTHNTGVNQLVKRRGQTVVESSWLIFAHELGHNIGAQHSFERGQGRTGGIMDYGDGKLKSHYQFNTRYRKSQVCKTLSSRVGKCRNMFVRASGGEGSRMPKSPSGCKVKEEGQSCVFPFKYKNQMYYDCTKAGHDSLWCATTVNGDGSYEAWGHCSNNDGRGKCWTTEHGPCDFPFEYKKKVYTTCTTDDHDSAWCCVSGSCPSDWGHCNSR